MDPLLNFVLDSNDLITQHGDSSDSEYYAPLESGNDPIVTIQPEVDLEEYYYMEDHEEFNNSESDQDLRQIEIFNDFSTMSLENNMTTYSPRFNEDPVTIQRSEHIEPVDIIFPHQNLSDIIHTIPATNDAMLLIWDEDRAGWKILRPGRSEHIILEGTTSEHPSQGRIWVNSDTYVEYHKRSMRNFIQMKQHTHCGHIYRKIGDGLYREL